MPTSQRLFEQIGEQRLRALLADFYDRVFTDVMIGYLFVGKSQARLVEMEYQLTAQFLGADVVYEGRSMQKAHQATRILDGHFARRTQILRETMADHGVPEEVQRAWLEHVESLRGQIVSAGAESCSEPASNTAAKSPGDGQDSRTDVIGSRGN